MSTFTEIKRLMKNQAAALSAEPEIASALRSYRRHGGEETENPWQVAGLYAYESKDARLVLEAFYLTSHDTCIVRLFREAPLEILYARKSVSDLTKLAAVLDEAAGQFLLHLKNAVPLQTSEAGYGLAARLFGKVFSQAMAPIPPPINLADVDS
jgi:hypothetical protein